jgi:two-component sensor histidine kinase
VADAALTDVLLLVSELVSNAVEHGRGAIDLRIELDGQRVRGEVADEGPGFDPRVHGQPFESTLHGGLLIVGQLAERWGVCTDTARVWFAVACAELPVASATPPNTTPLAVGGAA